MSRYTTELRYICEQAAGLDRSEGYMSIQQIIQTALPRIFDFDFPIYKEAYRATLETRILMHFYTREIGFETVGLWKLKLCERLNLIMPYYNRLYLALEEEFNPLYDTDLFKTSDGWNTMKEGVTGTNTEDTSATVDHTSTVDDTSTMTRNLKDTDRGTIDTDRTIDTDVKTTKDEWRKINDTPQGGINGLEQDVYITSAERDTANNDETTGTVDDSTEDRNLTYDHTGTEGTVGKTDTVGKDVSVGNRSGIDTKDTDRTGHDSAQEHTWGKSPGKSYSEMIKEYMDYVRNIDEMILNELNDLFMLIY